MRRTILGVLLCVSLLALALAPAAAAWPEKPVKVIVPFAPGGTTDTLARILQKGMQDQKLLPQPLTIINVGGHWSVGSTQVKNAAPDGYTFLLIHIALLAGEVTSPERKLSYRDFDAVALTGGFCLHPVVRQDSPYKSLRDVMEAAKAKPDSLIHGANMGGINHMAGIYLEQAYPGAKFRFVQIGGGAENFAALKGGQTDFAVISSSEYQNFKAGGIRALGYTGPARHPLEPDVPTVKEQGLDFTFCVNNYWFAPKGTPKEALDGMTAALEKALQLPEVQQAIRKQASTWEFLKGEEYKQHLDATFRSIAPIAQLSTKK
jgi:putative tricarboxylic transport membrane protein